MKPHWIDRMFDHFCNVDRSLGEGQRWLYRRAWWVVGFFFVCFVVVCYVRLWYFWFNWVLAAHFVIPLLFVSITLLTTRKQKATEP